MSTSLLKSLRVLEAVINSEKPRGISELSREMQMDKNAIQRAFQGLTQAGFLEKEPGTFRYRPTLRIWELGARVISRHEACRLVHPILRYGAKMSGLTAYFAWAQAPDIVYLDKAEGDKGRPNSSQPGRRIAMYRTAAGRAIMAFLQEIELTGVMRHMEAQSPDAGTQKAAALLAELPGIRTRLFATTQSGSFAQVNSIAAPVWAAGLTPVGSIVLTSDALTLPESDFHRVANVAVSMAEQATTALGGSYPGSQYDNP